MRIGFRLLGPICPSLPGLLRLLCQSCLLIAVAATASPGKEAPCNRQAALEDWLATRASEWENRLVSLPGYERPGSLLVCQAGGGGPRSDGKRIYLPPRQGDEQLLCLTHEYVHLAFRHHPATRDEAFVERTAKALMLGEKVQ